MEKDHSMEQGHSMEKEHFPQIRTDLALEARESISEADSELRGVRVEEYYHEEEDIRVTKVMIDTRNAAKATAITTIRFRRFSLARLRFASFFTIAPVSFSKGHVMVCHLLFRHTKLLYDTIFSAIPTCPFCKG